MRLILFHNHRKACYRDNNNKICLLSTSSAQRRSSILRQASVVMWIPCRFLCKVVLKCLAAILITCIMLSLEHLASTSIKISRYLSLLSRAYSEPPSCLLGLVAVVTRKWVFDSAWQYDYSWQGYLIATTQLWKRKDSGCGIKYNTSSIIYQG